MERKITEAGELLDSEGKLIETGYATSLIRRYDRNRIKANPLRIKEWDYYLITNSRYGLALTIDDNSYMGLMSVSFLDFSRRQETTKSEIVPFTMGKIKLPDTSVKGNAIFRNAKIQIAFYNDGNERRLCCTYPDFKDGKTLKADIKLSGVPKDSMVIVTPFKEDPHAFYYNQKINCLRASGSFSIGEDRYEFKPSDASGCLDWGRGVWTYKNTWYWSNVSGLVNGHRFGWNLGYGFGNTEAASENMLFYDGAAHKLDRVSFHIQTDAAGHEQYMRPWLLISNEERLHLTFNPILDRKADTNAGIIESDQHQVFGTFSGSVTLDDGKVLWIKDLLGFAEKVTNRW
ncbi:MAG: DUF2804 domain-containing protein [Solobacterium sp.]|jgi:hypothetical protein|nr:DUF2804 domain-containing protein [Solobacterium sp.]MCH4222374.1 DUF2804 domain-containing protein [Solobacterium sp.]MCH4265115.1 DUF2804 domain-containing protein [Solobacterium sp.]